MFGYRTLSGKVGCINTKALPSDFQGMVVHLDRKSLEEEPQLVRYIRFSFFRQKQGQEIEKIPSVWELLSDDEIEAYRLMAMCMAADAEKAMESRKPGSSDKSVQATQTATPIQPIVSRRVLWKEGEPDALHG